MLSKHIRRVFEQHYKETYSVSFVQIIDLDQPGHSLHLAIVIVVLLLDS